MSYIYKIENDVNGKQYIGKTEDTVEQRFKQHCRDSVKARCEKRPLYSAMNKYGCEHFHITLIEKCDSSIAAEREMYWIEHYGSFKRGYNATIGGDGKRYADYDLIQESYLQTHSIALTAKQNDVSVDTVSKILRMNGRKLTPLQTMTIQQGKIINMYDTHGKYVRSFPSIRAASRFLKDNNLSSSDIGGLASHISECCKGKRKSVCGFSWKYANIK